MLWMAVDADVYELPIAVADSVVKLARLLGVTKGAIYKKIDAEKTGEAIKGYKIRKVDERG